VSRTQTVDVLVIGGGITGLAVAHGLKRQGRDVHLVEASQRFGGVIESERTGEFLAEHGPNTVLATTAEIHRLVDEAGLSQRLQWADSQAGTRFIVRDRRLHAVPGGPMSFLTTPLFSPGAKLRLLAEPFIAASPPDAEETLASFVLRRLGREFLDYAINPMVSGVYAGRPEELEVRSAFPKVHNLEQQYGSLIKGAVLGAWDRRKRAKEGDVAKDRARLMSFPEGIEEFTTALARGLGDRAQRGARVRALAFDGKTWKATLDVDNGGPSTLHARAVVPAVPGKTLHQLIPDPDLAPLAQLPNPPVSVVFFGYESDPGGIERAGFGYLIPEKEPFHTLGTLWSSTLFPGRAPTGGAALTTFVGGRRAPDNATLPDDELIALVRGDVRALMGITAEPDLTRIGRYPEAIPQYTVGHRRRTEAAEAVERRHTGLYIGSSVVGGVSVGDRIRRAAALVERIDGDLSAAGGSA
jgi:protoporphyrinogen/coproporphyrinogen III oxidase